MVKWTQDQIAALTTEGLTNLRINASQRPDHAQATDIIEWCDTELLVRKVKKSATARRGRPGEERNAEAQADTQLIALARGLMSQYDLSPETAKGHSAGIKGFRSHALLSRKGASKVGGLQRSGQLALDRYISYRCMNDLITMEYILLNERPVEEARWVVIAPPNLMREGAPIVDQVLGLEAVAGAFEGELGLVTADFGEAADQFSALVAEIFIRHTLR